MQIMFDDAFFENEIIKQEQVKNQSIESGKLIDDVILFKLDCLFANQELKGLRKFGYLIQKNIFLSYFQKQKFTFGLK